MSLLAQRQEQRLRLVIGVPTLVVAAIAGLAVLLAGSPGAQPRASMLDVLTRLAARPDSTLPVATLMIDEESAAQIGEWPWPRSALGALVDAAEAAGAASVTLTISVAGADPLSPDVVAQRWLSVPGVVTDTEIAVLSQLPSNDLMLARAVAGGPVGLGITSRVPGTDEPVSWGKTSANRAPWLALTMGQDAPNVFALPTARAAGSLSPELNDARVFAVTGFPYDADGHVRRAAPLYLADGQPAAAASLAALLASGERVTIGFRNNLLTTVGDTPSTLAIGDGQPLALTSRSDFRLWFPRDVRVPTVSAWRALTDPEAWTGALKGRHVYIGEAFSNQGYQRTARGRMPTAQLHALTAQQMELGVAPIRPAWAGLAEAATAFFLGMTAVLAVVFLPSILSTLTVLALAGLCFGAAYLTFQQTGILLDPSPAALASLLGPIAVGATVLANMVVRDDQVRGAFHGALPEKAMRQVQTASGKRLLSGVHREVTVLSCSLELPKPLLDQFKDDPEAYMDFQGSANDRLRRTILDHQGTVDYGEDGRLLGYWNVPIEEEKHIELACSCALKMLDDVSAMSQHVSEGHHLGKDDGVGDLSDGRIEIGIASGSCFAGPAGLGGRNRYAAMGQPVSFAGRLRARSELYGPAILADARVYEALRHHYAFLDLDFVRRENVAEPELIYGLVGNPFLKASKTFRELAEVQRGMLDAWREQDLSTATRQLQKLRGIPGVPQGYAELFERRIMNARLAKARSESDTAEVLGP